MNRHFGMWLLVGWQLFSTNALHADNWAGFRGNRGDGVSTETKIPTSWSPTDNILWKTALPNRLGKPTLFNPIPRHKRQKTGTPLP